MQLPQEGSLTYVSDLSQAHLFGRIQNVPGLPAVREPGKCGFIPSDACNSGHSNGCQKVIHNFSHFGMNLSDYQA